MTFDNFDAAFFTAGALVPGFVWSAVLALSVPRRSSAIEIRVMEVLTLSSINYALWSWAIYLVFKTGFKDNHPYWSGLALGGIIFVSPIVLGIVSTRLRRMRAVAWLLNRLGFRTVNPVPTAWDWLFSQAKPYWALVTLKDGSQVYGLFGVRSFAGDDRLLDSGDWAPEEDTAGVLIAADQITAIEFRKIGEVTYEE